MVYVVNLFINIYHNKEIIMTDNDIQKALDDIREMKRSIEGNLRIMRPIFLDRAFIPFCYLSGAFFAILFVSLDLALSGASGLAGTPMIARVLWLAFALAGTIALSAYKTRIIKGSIARQNRSLSILSLFAIREFRSLYLILLYGVCLTLAGVGFFAFKTGQWWAFLPASFLFLAFTFAMLGLYFSVKEFNALSAVTLALGLLALFFGEAHVALWVGIALTAISVAYGITIQKAK